MENLSIWETFHAQMTPISRVETMREIYQFYRKVPMNQSFGRQSQGPLFYIL